MAFGSNIGQILSGERLHFTDYVVDMYGPPYRLESVLEEISVTYSVAPVLITTLQFLRQDPHRFVNIRVTS